MGNEVSRKRYCCRKSRKFKRLEGVQENREADHPSTQTPLGAALWNGVNHPPKEKSQDTATGMQNKDVGKESAVATSSVLEAEIMERTTEPQDPGEAQPSAEQSETESEPTTVSPDRKTYAPTQKKPAAAQQAEGDAGVTSDLPLQTVTGARDAEDVTEQAPVQSTSALCKGPCKKMCKPSPLCRWLKKLRSPAEKAKAKPDAITSQE